jgi:hypothetical protein
MGLQTFNRGLRQIKFAPWLDENSYGPTHTILGARSVEFEWVVETDEARGDDAVLDRYTRQMSVMLTIEQATIDLLGFSVLTGSTLTSTGAYEDLLSDGDIPYVAMAWRVVGSGGNTDLHFFVPKVKLASNLTFSAAQDTYLFPRAQFQGVFEGDINAFLRQRNFTALTNLEIPLRTTTGGFS